MARRANGSEVTLSRYALQFYDRTLADIGGVIGWTDSGQFRLKLKDGTPVHHVEGETFEVFGTWERLTLI